MDSKEIEKPASKNCAQSAVCDASPEIELKVSGDDNDVALSSLLPASESQQPEQDLIAEVLANPKPAVSVPNTSLQASAIPLSVKPDVTIDWPKSRKRQLFNVIYFGLVSFQLFSLSQQVYSPWALYFGLFVCAFMTAGSVYYLFNHRHHQTSVDELTPGARRSLRAVALLIPALMMMFGFIRYEIESPQMMPAPTVATTGFDAEMALGKTASKRHHYRQAIQHFKLAAGINPQSDSAFEWLAISYNSLFKFDAAVTFGEKAIALNPKNENAHVNLAYSLNMLGRHNEAITMADAAIALDPEDGEAYGYKSKALSALGDFKDALLADNMHVKYHSNEWMAYRQRAATLDALGRSDEARYTRGIEEMVRNKAH